MFLKGERETILNYDPETKTWYAWTSYPPHINRLRKKGWKLTAHDFENGREISATFTAPKNAVMLKDLTKLVSVSDSDDEDDEDEEIPAEE